MPGVHEDAPGIFVSSTELAVPGAAQHDCTPFLTALLARFPGLSSLSLDLCQQHTSGDAVARREGALHGPLPHSLLPLCGGITDLRIKDAAGHEALLLQAMVSFRRTLLRLDVSGLGGLALPALLTAGLDQLLLLRVGECRDSHGAGITRPHRSVLDCARWPAGVTVDEIGGALPSLTALDMGFAECRPVNIVDLQRLLLSNTVRPRTFQNHRDVQLRHLDLSQVMAYMDFDPGVHALAEGAPQLESLAIFGLHVSDDALRTLGQMSQLSTCHLVACSNHTAAGLALFLESAAKLRQIDLSFGLAPVESLRQWLSRHSPRHDSPIARATLVQSYRLDAQRLLLTAADFEELLDAAAGRVMLIAAGGAVSGSDSAETVAQRVGVSGTVVPATSVAQYQEGLRENWHALQQRYSLRILDNSPWGAGAG